ncbi:MAG: helix-turn-helix domain-containing protein [Planctomycetaceae bacterium]|nr:helix-turn-helix domain-containing protein [Planctomycetaceae bacterium]
MHDSPEVSRLLLTAEQAAESLTISPRKLWELTSTGQLPCVRIGRAVRYDRADLEAWIAAQKRSR